MKKNTNKLFNKDVISSDPEIVYQGMLIEISDELEKIVNNFDRLQRYLSVWTKDPCYDLSIDSQEWEVEFGVDKDKSKKVNRLLSYYQDIMEGLWYVKKLKKAEKTADAFDLVLNFIKKA